VLAIFTGASITFAILCCGILCGIVKVHRRCMNDSNAALRTNLR
jgi:hypothetical protein